MHFESLIGKPALEPDLMKLLVSEIQSHYAEYQDLCFFMKLAKLSDRQCEISWIKCFSSPEDLKDFYYDTVMDRACVMCKFRDGRYEVLCRGFYYSNWFEVWSDRSSPGRPMEYNEYRETTRMIPRELLEQGFGEIKQAFGSSKKAV